MSLLPPKILKIMEWIGFSGDGSGAIKKLNECADSKTLRSAIAVMTPWSYYYIFEFQFGSVCEKEGVDIAKVNTHFEGPTWPEVREQLSGKETGYNFARED